MISRRSFVNFLHLSIILLLSTSLPGVSRAENHLTITVDKDEHIIFDYAKSACAKWDVPDTPTRAYRDVHGKIHLFQTHFESRQMVGDSLDNLVKDCDVLYEGADSNAPETYDNRSWIGATYTPDGIQLMALLHNEYQGHRFGSDRCPTKVYRDCWYNSLTSTTAANGPSSFPKRPPDLVASIPLRADQTRGGHAGFFEPSNIFGDGKFWFFTANVVSPPPQKGGNCLFRSPQPMDPSLWRVWRAGNFSTQLANPYQRNVNQRDSVCDPLDKSSLPWPLRSVVRHERTGLWIGLMLGRLKDATGVMKTGIYYSTSRNLIDWKGPTLLYEGNINKSECGQRDVILYPALIDEKSKSINFDTVGDSPALTFVRIALNNCKTTLDRNIVYHKVVEISDQ